MECLGSFSKTNLPAPSTVVLRSRSLPLSPSLSLRKRNQIGVLRASLSEDNDPLFLNAKHAASLRFIESCQSEPLFIDPFAGCFASPDLEMKEYSRHYCFATKFVDDKLLQALNHINGPKQVVLLTDGMDARPYRLRWPMSTIIFDISPDTVYKRAVQELQGNGAKISRGNFFYHIPFESPNILQELRMKGFRGDRPSIWVMQGLPIMALGDFENILFMVSSLAMKGSLFLGELPYWLTETEINFKSSTSAATCYHLFESCQSYTSTAKRLKKFFMGNGFRVEMISIEEVARRLCKELTFGTYKNIPFAAEQLRFSDDQMEIWRQVFDRIEGGVDEEGFEEL